MMVDKKTFLEKYKRVIKIFKDWMPKNFPFKETTILDFGCEHGIMALGLAQRLKCKMVYGVDINELHRELLDLAREYINLSELPSNLEFFRVKPLEKISDKVKADVIFTWSVMEHVSRDILVDVIKEFYSILTPNGYVFIQIAPLYYSPEGAHFYGLTDEAWIHLKTQNNLLSKNIKNLPKEKSGYSMLSDDVYRNIIEGIWSTYETLNKVTAKELVSLFTSNGFRIVNEKYFHVDLNPPEQLLEIYQKEILTNYQMVVLFQKD